MSSLSFSNETSPLHIVQSLPLELQTKIFSYLPFDFFESLNLRNPQEFEKIEEIWKRVFLNLPLTERALIFNQDKLLQFYLKKEVREIFGYDYPCIKPFSIGHLAHTAVRINRFICENLGEIPVDKTVKLVLFGLNENHLLALESSIKSKIDFSSPQIKEILKRIVEEKKIDALRVMQNSEVLKKIDSDDFFEILKLCFNHYDVGLLEILMESPFFHLVNQDQISDLFLEACKDKKTKFISILRCSPKAHDLPPEIISEGFRFGSLIQDSEMISEILKYPNSALISEHGLSRGLFNAVSHNFLGNIRLILSSTHATRIPPAHFGVIFRLSCEKTNPTVANLLQCSPLFLRIEDKELKKALLICCSKNHPSLAAAILSHPNLQPLDQTMAYEHYKKACENDFPAIKTILFDYIPEIFQICERFKRLSCTIS